MRNFALILIIAVAACSSAPKTSSYQSANAEFSKALASLEKYTSATDQQWRSTWRQESLLWNHRMLEFGLAKPVPPGYNFFDQMLLSVDYRPLLCNPYVQSDSMRSALPTFGYVSETLASLTTTPTEAGTALFITSLTKDYWRYNPANGEDTNEDGAAEADGFAELTDACVRDIDEALKALEERTASNIPSPVDSREAGAAAMFAAVELVVAALKKLDGALGAIGREIDESKRAAALRELLNDEELNMQLTAAFSQAEAVFAARDRMLRVSASADYILAFEVLRRSYQAADTILAASESRTASETVEAIRKATTAAETKVIATARAYDMAVESTALVALGNLEAAYKALREHSNETSGPVDLTLIAKLSEVAKSSYESFIKTYEDLKKAGDVLGDPTN